jgi:hypothetical protein
VQQLAYLSASEFFSGQIRKLDNKFGKDSRFRIYFNTASMRFHNIVTQTQPKPVPWPVGFVVKKGWKIFSFMFSGIPLPLSATLISIFPFCCFVLTTISGL